MLQSTFFFSFTKITYKKKRRRRRSYDYTFNCTSRFKLFWAFAGDCPYLVSRRIASLTTAHMLTRALTSHYALTANASSFFFLLLFKLQSQQKPEILCVYGGWYFTIWSGHNTWMNFAILTTFKRKTIMNKHIREEDKKKKRFAAGDKTVGLYFRFSFSGHGLVNRTGRARKKNCKTQQQKQRDHC